MRPTFRTASGKTLTFSSKMQKQRAGLLLESVKDPKGGSHKTLFVAFGGIAEDHPEIHGRVLAFDVDSFKFAASFVTTQEGSEGGGGIWQAAQGPCADGNGGVFFMTGNGSWNGSTDFAETSSIKLQYTPPFEGHGAELKIADWFTPIADEGGFINGADFPGCVTGNTNDRGTWDDQDLGSGGPLS